MLLAPKRKIFWHSLANAVAAGSFGVVQCTSMVALAPNTSETSPWDVLDTFPKLHSRAREEFTSSCTEVPHSKSLCRVEIWLTIYESCDGLESFTRDPIESDENLYEYCWSSPLCFMDPTGNHPIAIPVVGGALVLTAAEQAAAGLGFRSLLALQRPHASI